MKAGAARALRTLRAATSPAPDGPGRAALAADGGAAVCGPGSPVLKCKVRDWQHCRTSVSRGRTLARQRRCASPARGTQFQWRGFPAGGRTVRSPGRGRRRSALEPVGQVPAAQRAGGLAPPLDRPSPRPRRPGELLTRGDACATCTRTAPARRGRSGLGRTAGSRPRWSSEPHRRNHGAAARTRSTSADPGRLPRPGSAAGGRPILVTGTCQPGAPAGSTLLEQRRLRSRPGELQRVPGRNSSQPPHQGRLRSSPGAPTSTGV